MVGGSPLERHPSDGDAQISPVDAAAAVVVVDRSISYLRIILVGAVLFLARQVFRPAKTAVSPLGTTAER